MGTPQPDRHGSARPPDDGATVLREQVRPLLQIARQLGITRAVRRRPGANEQIDRGEGGEHLTAGVLPEATAQPIAGHRRVAESRGNNTESWVTTVVGTPENLEAGGTSTGAAGHHCLKVGRARETPVPREALGRQAAPCLEGILTVNCRRPFLRRRLRTARPHRVFIRARKPCLRMRRLFRGWYVGCIDQPSSEPENVPGQAIAVKVDFSTLAT